ncbi:hypothetical protein FRC12_019320 [Ceratobasidium sp. 428]|nr:hypothetical protein FRC12_019320 [Ceratobasidium sp. 428]
MIDFKSRRFTVRLGRNNKSGLVSGEQANKRASIVGRKASVRRRVSTRNTGALRRAPSGAGGLNRGASVRRSQSGVRRGASVRRAPSAARRTSKRMSAYVDGITPSPSFQTSDAETGPAATLKPPVLLDQAHIQPTTSPAPSKSFFSKLTSRFRGRSKTSKAQTVISTQPSALAATFSATNLSPVGCAPPRSPSLRSPSPGSRVKFVDTPVEEPSTASDAPADNNPPADPRVESSPVSEEEKKSPEVSDPTPAQQEIVDESDGPDDEWVDAEDENLDLEPHISPAASNDPAIVSEHVENTITQPAVPEPASTEVDIPEQPVAAAHDAKSEETARDQDLLAAVRLQTEVVDHLVHDSVGLDVRVNQWLAVTPDVIVKEESQLEGDGPVQSLESGEVQTQVALPKAEARRRPPHIIVPGTPSLSSNNPFRVPLPPSPSPSTLPETNPFRSLIAANSSLTAETLSPEGFVPPPSPSILLTPAVHEDLELSRSSDELLAVDSTQIPLPPSPSPSYASLAQQSEDSPVSPSTTAANMRRNGSVSTSGGRSLSTAPSTRGPTTPTSIRIPGHPALAHFSFGGPRSPSLKIEDWEEGEEERRGRSLEVASSKRRMRSTSPGLDAVLEGDESRRSSKTSIEGLERKGSPELKQPLSPLPVVEEVTTFGSKRDDDTDSQHEDEDGFFAFAEQQLEKDRKAAEVRQLEVPKRSKTMSFLGGFGKRKSTVGDPRPMSPPAAASSGGLLGLPTQGPKRSSTLLPESSNRISRLMPAQRSSTMMTLAEPRVALSPTMYTVGDIHTETGKIEDDESRRLSEAVFMF